VSAEEPLILLSNDDGIASPGLLYAARALAPLGRLLVVAPLRQHSAWGRAMPAPVGEVQRVPLPVEGTVEAWSVDASPALTVRWALLTRARTSPALVIAGINYGENLGVSLPVSGTVGAASEGAIHGIPAFAISLQTDLEHHNTHSPLVDFAAAGDIAARLASAILARGLPPDVDLLNVNVPHDAGPETPWRWTRVSRHNYYENIIHRANGEARMAGYRVSRAIEEVEPDADIRALALDRVVSVTPLTIDPTAAGLMPDGLDALLDKS
jgi:5'-nucleotidase